MATKTEKEKKRKCSVLTKHVKEYIKKEEEDKKKNENKNKNKNKKNQEKQITPSQITVFFICGDPIHVISYIRSGKLIYTRLGHTIIGDDAYLLGFK